MVHKLQITLLGIFPDFLLLPYSTGVLDDKFYLSIVEKYSKKEENTPLGPKDRIFVFVSPFKPMYFHTFTPGK